MRPGSSDRCKAKYFHLRCHRHHGHEGQHSAPAGRAQIKWADATPEVAS